MRSFWLPWLALAVLLLAGCDAGEWETYRVDEEEGYMVALPEGAERPESVAVSLLAAGEQVNLDLIRFSAEGANYTIGHSTLDDEVESGRAIELLLDDAERWLVEESDVRPRELESSALSWNGYPGRELRFRIGGEEGDSRGQGNILLVEEELYLVFATGPDEVMDERADKFLASFTAVED